MLTLLLVCFALGHDPSTEVSVQLGRTATPFTFDLGTVNTFGGLAVRTPVRRDVGFEVRGAVYRRVSGGQLGLAESVAMIRDLSVSPYSLGVPQPLWTGSAAATWTPLRGQVSVAEEMAVDVDLRLVAGVEVHRGGIERIGSGRSADETVVPLADMPLWRTGRDEAYTGVGPALGFSARAWLGPMAALDLDVRDAWYRGPASETALSFDDPARPAPETVWRDQATVSLAVTVTEPRRRTAVLGAD